MTDRLQTGVHPDADQISVFLEGAATEQERAQMLEHLAHCASCRETVFLAQGAETELHPVAVAVPESGSWRRWSMPFGLVGAAVALAVVLMIYMRAPVRPVGDQQMAAVQQPSNPANEPRAKVEEKETPQQPVQNSGPGKGPGQGPAGPERKPAPVVGYGSGGGVGAGGQMAPPPAPVPAVAMNEQGIEAARGNMARLSQNAAGVAPASPAAAAVPKVLESPAPQLPAAQAPQGGPTASQAYSQAQLSTMNRNLAPLQIVHDQGTSEGMGEVRGIVTDATGAAIGQASVSLNGGTDEAVREVATGPDGRFRIADVPEGHYELRVSARGFNTRSEQLELKARDVAKLDSVLQVGAEAQTVTVEANNAPLPTSEVSAASLVPAENLPGGVVAIARVAAGGRMLSVDAAGQLYLSRNAGKSWKKIKPQWPGKAVQLAVVPSHQTAHQAAESETVTVQPKATENPQLFEMTTDAGAVWTSEDGERWRPRADGNQ